MYFHSPARELMSTPPSQRNGSVHLTVGTQHSQGGSRGPSPHMSRRGENLYFPIPVLYYQLCFRWPLFWCSAFKAPKSRHQLHPNWPAPSPLSPVTPRHLALTITHPSCLVVTPAERASKPRTIHRHSLLNPTTPRGSQSHLLLALPPLLTLRLMTAHTPTCSPHSTLDLCLAPLSRLQSHGCDPTCRRPHSLQQMTLVMASAALPPRS